MVPGVLLKGAPRAPAPGRRVLGGSAPARPTSPVTPPPARGARAPRSSRAGAGSGGPGIPSRGESRRTVPRRGTLGAPGPPGDTPPRPHTYQIIHVQKRLRYPEISHPAPKASGTSPNPEKKQRLGLRASSSCKASHHENSRAPPSSRRRHQGAAIGRGAGRGRAAR